MAAFAAAGAYFFVKRASKKPNRETTESFLAQ
jgi:hypothetical protein